MLVVALAIVALAGPLDPPADVMPPSPIGEHRIPITPSPEAPGILINTSGSYFLTGNVIGSSGNNGIEISANNVTLDLRGFGVIGVPGSLDGITVTAVNRVNIRVYGGTIRGWGGDGVDLSNVVNAAVADVQSVGNGGNGIRIRGGNLSDSQFRANTGSGIVATGNVMVRNCLVEGNTTHGIDASGGGIFSDSIITLNGGKGVSLGAGSTLMNSTIASNTLSGIDADGPATEICECLVRNNTEHGIEIGTQVTVRNNTISNNGGATFSNIFLHASQNHVEGNTINVGVFGIRGGPSAFFNFIGRNTVFANTTGYSFSGTNFIGTVSANAAAVGPWTNFNF